MSKEPTRSSVTVSGGEPRRERQCGRCRLNFPADPTLHPTAQPGWWLCPSCRETLLGRGTG